MAQNSSKDLGKTMEMKICPKYASEPSNKNAREDSRLLI
jgi:hypothetical protein